MAKYKNGQFVKVQNIKGLYRMRAHNDSSLACRFCALHNKNCGEYFDCFKSIGNKGYLEKIKEEDKCTTDK